MSGKQNSNITDVIPTQFIQLAPRYCVVISIIVCGILTFVTEKSDKPYKKASTEYHALIGNRRAVPS